MAVTLVKSETYGTASGTTADATQVNLLGTDAASGTDSGAASPITIPTGSTVYSYERFIRAKFTSTYNTVSNVKFWKSAGSFGTGYSVNAASRGANAYTTPTGGSTTQSTYATAAVPTVVGSALTASSGNITGDGSFSQYIVLQAAVTSSATVSSSTSCTYTWQWDET